MSDALQFDNGLNIKWREAVNAHKEHAAAEFPKEAVGIISQDGGYHPCENISPEPTQAFEVADARLREVDGGRPAALLHSHTAAAHPVTGQTRQPNSCPSAEDMRAQLDMAIPWGISLCVEGGASDPFWFGDQVPHPPLYGRTFRHGVFDCYSLVRDWHREVVGITIPEFPRGLDWWEANEEGENVQDLYMKGFEEAGFVRVDRPYAPLPGDCFMCKVRSEVINHAGVYIGHGLIAHHLLWQLSARQPASLWRPKLDFLVRHRDLPEDWSPPDV